MEEQSLETSTLRTHQYLRIGVGAAAILIGVGIAVDLIHGGDRRLSISDFYYSDARNVFVGALVAVSLGLFALSGFGLQRLLLDAAAMFAPLIGLIPAPDKDWDVDAVDRGVWSYLVFGVMLLVFVLLLRLAKSRQGVRFEDERGFWWSIGIGVVWLIALAVTFLAFPDFFRSFGHLGSAGAFFILIAAVALTHGFEPSAKVKAAAARDLEQPKPTSPQLKVLYRVVGVVLGADVVVLIVVGILGAHGVLSLTWPLVAILEAAALVLFAFFWFVQSWQWRGLDNSPGH